MEVKLSLRQRPPDLRLPLSFQSKSNFPTHSLYLKSWAKSERSFRKRIRSTVKKWRLRIQEISDGQSLVMHNFVHVVKEGETLTSIAKQYGVSVYAIATANKNVVDIDLVYEGQHLNIPSVAKNVQAAARSWSANFKLPDKVQNCLNISNGALQQKNFSMLHSPLLPHAYPSYNQARTIACFLVLVPILALCIRCILGAFHGRVAREFRHQGTNDSSVNHHRSGGGRWKSALGEAWGPDVMDAESIPHSSEVRENHSEDQDQISYEDESHAYRKLEHDYQEFLAQCGMSKFGYWRGGSPR